MTYGGSVSIRLSNRRNFKQFDFYRFWLFLTNRFTDLLLRGFIRLSEVSAFIRLIELRFSTGRNFTAYPTKTKCIFKIWTWNMWTLYTRVRLLRFILILMILFERLNSSRWMHFSFLFATLKSDCRRSIRHVKIFAFSVFFWMSFAKFFLTSLLYGAYLIFSSSNFTELSYV